MTTPRRLVVALTLAASTALPVAAQDLPIPIRIAVGCGPQATADSEHANEKRGPDNDGDDPCDVENELA